MPDNGADHQSGNIFFTLFGAIALIGVIGAATTTLVRGPLSTVSAVNMKAKVDSQLAIASKLATIAATQVPGGGNCDALTGDTYMDPLHPVTGAPAPAGGGQLPGTIGASQVDPWGTPLGYCVWDLGSGAAQVGDPSCDPAGTDIAYLAAGDDPTQPVFVIMSAGPDRIFQTECNPWADNIGSTTPPTNAGPMTVAGNLIYKPASSDDIIAELSYQEAQSAADGLWSIMSGDPGTITTDKNVAFGSSSSVEFQSSANFAASASAVFAQNSRLDLGLGGLFLLPDDSTLTTCNAANTGTLRLNKTSNAPLVILEMCDPSAVPNWFPMGGAGTTVSSIDDLSDAAAGADYLFMGDGAGLVYNSASGSNNLGIGISAASTLTTGKDNIIIGNSAKTFAAGTTDSIVIGQGITGGGNDTLQIGGFISGSGLYSSAGTLDISGTVEANLFRFDGNLYIDDSAGGMVLATGGTPRVTISSAGNVTIAPAGAGTELTVSGDAEVVGDTRSDQFIATGSSTSGVPGFTFEGYTNSGLYYDSSANLGFTVGGSSEMELGAAGLTVHGNGDFEGYGIFDEYVQGDNFQFNDSTTSGLYFTSGAGLSLKHNGSIGVFVGGGGNVGIGGNVSPNVDLDVAGAMRAVDAALTDADCLAGTMFGAIRYVAATDTMEICSSTTSQWEDFGTSGGGGGGAASYWTRISALDPRLYYNADFVGVGTNDPLADFHVNGDFLVSGTYSGTPSIAYGSAGTKMFFDPDSSAFRAGTVTGAQWSQANTGNYSAAFGLDNTAPGAYSFTAGRLNTASNTQSIALGYGVTSSGDASVATGSLTSATGNYSVAMGLKATASGANSVAFGLGNPAANAIVSANNSFGIFMGDQQGVDLNTANVMLLAGGSLVIDPDATTALNIAPDNAGLERMAIDVEGTIGAIQYCDEAGNNCFTPAAVASGSVGVPGFDREIIYNSNGTLWTTAGFVFSSSGFLGIGNINPEAAIDVGGTGAVLLPRGDSTNRPAGVNGMIRYNSASGKFEAYQGGVWEDIITTAVAGGAAGADTQIQYNSGGEFYAEAEFAWDGTNNILTIANSATGTVLVGDGAVRVGNGAVGTPSLSFTGDTNTGLYNVGADALGFAANGVNYLTVQAPGAANASAIFGGNAAITLPSGTTLQQPSAGVNGMIRYNTDNGKFEAYQAGAWQDILTSAVAGGAAAPDRGIQFNSGGDFTASSNLIYAADGDLLLTGTYTGTASVPASGAGTRMFFDTQTAAFRAGSVSGAQWNDASLGSYSVAMGLDTESIGTGSVALGWGAKAHSNAATAFGVSTTASHVGSTAMGSNTTASGQYSLATGEITTASGYAGTAMGHRTIAAGDYSAAFGRELNISATGDGSAGFGLTTTSPATDPIVSGAQSFALFMGNHSTVNFAAANTMGLFGGKMVIDPNVPATQLSARSVLDLGAATDALVLPRGTTGQQPVGVNGMLRYNSTTDKFEGYQGGLWQDILTSAVSGGAAAPDRGIQFNSGGNFAADSNLVYSSAGAFMVSGTFAGAGTEPVSGAGTRMFFDPGKSVFRVGTVSGNQWDFASAGVSSVAMGWDTVASGMFSTAMGSSTVASGMFSTAMGSGTVASGITSTAMGSSGTVASGSGSTAIGSATVASGSNSTAMGGGTVASGLNSTAIGANVTAGNGTAGSGFGDYSMAIGLTSTFTPNYAQVTGTGSFGIFMQDQHNVVFASNNTMGLFGGQMVIDPNVPATQLSARSVLDLGAATDALVLPRGTTGQQPVGVNGMLRYNSTTDKFEGYQGGLWQDILTSAVSGGAAAPDRGIQFNSGGSFTASSNLVYAADGDLLLTGAFTGIASVPASGAGTRMFFDTQKAAFRAGNVSGTQWDNASIGNFSTAMGYNAMANGIISTAMGLDVAASGNSSVAMGQNATASGSISTATGYGTTASGSYSTAMGNSVVAGNGTAGSGFGNGSMALGLIDGFIITTPSQVRGSQALGIFMGDQDGLVMTAASTMGLFGGQMVIDPNVPATQLSARSVLDLGAATDALVLPRGTTGQQPVGVNGMLRYNSTTDKFEGYQGGLWQDILTSAVSGGAAAPDRGIQFNSGGSFAASSNLVYSSQGAFMVSGAHTTVGAPPATGAGTRMFFDPTKAAFRAGSVIGTEWDNASIGNYSVAMGQRTTASGAFTLATGYRTTASGNHATAMGMNTAASGSRSMAIGSDVTAGDGTGGSGFGDGSMAVGLIDDGVTITTPSQVTGIQSYGIFMGDQDGLVMTANNTMGLFGGKMVIDPNVPATQLSARSVLDLGAATDSVVLPAGTTAQRPGTPVNGMIRYNSTSGKFEGYQAGVWTDIITAGAAASAPDRGIQFNSGGSFAASNLFTYQSSGDFIVGSTQKGDTGNAAHDSRMFFDKAKAAFRAGTVAGAQWDNASIGNQSVALGSNTTASGASSVALGTGTIASGDYSVALGQGSTASGASSVALGLSTASGDYSTALGFATASGFSSTAMGNMTVASGMTSTAMGQNTTASGQNALSSGYRSVASGYTSMALGSQVIAGNGIAGSGWGDGSMAVGLIDDAVTITTPSQVRGIQSMGIFMGDQDGLVMTANNTMGLFGGKMVIDPNVPATQLSARSVLDLGAATDSIIIPAGTTGQRPGAPVNGMLRYNSTSGKFEGYQAGIWTDIITSGGTAAAPDRGIQFNSGGSFAASGAFTYDGGKLYLESNGTFGGFGARLAGMDYYRHFQIENSDSTGGSFAGMGLRIGSFDSGLFSVYSGVGGQGRLALVTENVEALSILLDGSGTRVGIKTDSPAYTLDVNGDIGIPGNGIIYSSGRPFLSNRASLGTIIIATDTYGGNPHDSTGTANTIMGFMAGENITTGGANTLIGNNAGYDLSTQNNNTFVGSSAGLYMSGSNNTALGQNALQHANAGIQDSVYLGASAGSGDSGNSGGASKVVAIGVGAGLYGDGVNNVFIGYSTGSSASTGTDNILLGYDIELPTAATSNHLNIGGLVTGTLNAGLMQINGTGALTLPVGTTAQQPASPVNGMLRYNSTSGKFEGYQGGVWTDIITSGGAAASPDRGIQFNSGGSFAAAAGLVYSSTGDLMVSGTYTGTASVPATGAGTRMFFDVQKSAFRVGTVFSTNWDNASIGEYSFGAGYNPLASGIAAVAMGYEASATGSPSVAIGESAAASGNHAIALGYYASAPAFFSAALGNHATATDGLYNIALGNYATAKGDSSAALGNYTTASGTGSTALGSKVTAGDGTLGSGFGNYSVAIGAANPAVAPQVRGTDALGIFLSDTQSGVIFSASNTMGIFGGKVVIDPNGPATQLSARSVLDLGAATDSIIIPAGTTGQRPGTGVNGMLRYNSTSGKFEGYQGGVWTDIITSGGTAAAPDRGIQFNSGGSFAAAAGLVYSSTGDLMVSGTFTGIASVPASGAGTRMFFDTQKAAFRAGDVSGTEWDDAEIGDYSTAFGRNATASGIYAFAQGWDSFATGNNSIAMGNFTYSSADNAVAIGYTAQALASGAVAIGYDLGAEGLQSVAIGKYNWADATAARSLVLGHGSVTKGNDAVAIGNSVTASGAGSIALGGYVIAGDDVAASGMGDGSMALGLIDDAVTITTPSQVTGIQSYGIFMGDQDGLVMSAANTMGLFGGQMVIDPNVPATQLSARSVLDLGAATDSIIIPAGTTGQRPGTGVNGMLRYNSTSGKFEGYQGGVWTDIITSGGAAAAPDTGIQFNSGGSFAASSKLTWLDSTGTLQFSSGGSLASSKISSSTAEMVIEQTGDTYGTTRLRLQNRDGSNGAIFENPSMDLVDFGFLTSTSKQLNVRVDGRVPETLTGNSAQGEFQVIDPDGFGVGAPEFYARIGKQYAYLGAPEVILGGNGALTLTSGDTAYRPASPVNGMLRYNSTSGKFEGYQSGSWQDIVTGAATSTFLSLTDTPASYAGAAGQFVKVNAGANALEFTDTLVNSFSGQPAPTGMVFDDLDDVVITAVASGQFPVYNGTNWVNAANLSWNGTTLAATGNITFSGTLTDTSDMRLKTDIVPLRERGSMLDKLGQIDTYSFRMKDDPEGQVEFGVMAQEINTIFPELVEVDESTAEKYMSVNYLGLIAPLLEATKELKAENDTLKSELATMQTAMADIQGDIKGLKAHTGYGISKASMGLGMIIGMIAMAGFSALFFAVFTLRRQRRQLAGQLTSIE